MKKNRVINNAKWIVLCKLAQSALQLVVGMISARYLGPSNYGLISYAASIVAFAIPIMRLGFDATLVREYVESPDQEGKIAGTSVTLNLISSVACIFGVIGFSTVSNVNDHTTILVCSLYSLSLIFAAVEMIQYWFQYKLLSKYSSVIMLGSYFAVSAYKIFLLVTQKSVYWFAVTHSIEYCLIALCLFAVYYKQGGRLSFSWALAKKLLKNSKHYILAALMLVLIQNTDHIMLTLTVGEAENGFYSAAITAAGIFQFVYTAVVDSYRPVILDNKKKENSEYSLNMTRLYSLTLYLSLAQSVVFTVFGEIIIGILYGNDYAAAVPVFRILVWFLAFSMMGSVRNVWILAEQKQKYLWVINLSGALFNIVLNFVLIKPLGACGAALASLMTQVFSNLILGFIWKPLRENNKLIINSLRPNFAFGEAKKLLHTVLKKNDR